MVATQYLGLSLHKLLHLCLFFGRFHPAVNLAQAELRKSLLQRLITFFQILQVHLFALLDQREDDINLSAQINLPADALVETGQLIIKLMQCLNRFSARRQLRLSRSRRDRHRWSSPGFAG